MGYALGVEGFFCKERLENTVEGINPLLMHSLFDLFGIPTSPLRWVFFAWEASWGKVLTLDQL